MVQERIESRKGCTEISRLVGRRGEDVEISVNFDIDANVDVDRYFRLMSRYLPCCRYENE